MPVIENSEFADKVAVITGAGGPGRAHAIGARSAEPKSSSTTWAAALMVAAPAMRPMRLSRS